MGGTPPAVPHVQWLRSAVVVKDVLPGTAAWVGSHLQQKMVVFWQAQVTMLLLDSLPTAHNMHGLDSVYNDRCAF